MRIVRSTDRHGLLSCIVWTVFIVRVINFFSKSKLRGLYNTAMQDAESEAELLRKTLDKISEIRSIRSERRIQSKNAGNYAIYNCVQMNIGSRYQVV